MELAASVREENGAGVLFAVSFPAMEAVLAGGAMVRVERARVVHKVDDLQKSQASKLGDPALPFQQYKQDGTNE